MRPAILLPVLLSLFVALACAETSTAQSRPVRVGVGLDGVVNVFDEQVSDKTLALGIRGRFSWGYNEQLSFVLGAGLAGFFLDGTNNADYLLNPQASVVIKLAESDRNPYIITGLGAYYATEDWQQNFALHFGYGWVYPMSNSAAYFEIDPALIIRAEDTSVIVPVRVGIILY
ncbi:MAG: hypothetical protein AAF752_03895 [Bacteroidota bacterium]